MNEIAMTDTSRALADYFSALSLIREAADIGLTCDPSNEVVTGLCSMVEALAVRHTTYVETLPRRVPAATFLHRTDVARDEIATIASEAYGDEYQSLASYRSVEDFSSEGAEQIGVGLDKTEASVKLVQATHQEVHCIQEAASSERKLIAKGKLMEQVHAQTVALASRLDEAVDNYDGVVALINAEADLAEKPASHLQAAPAVIDVASPGPDEVSVIPAAVEDEIAVESVGEQVAEVVADNDRDDDFDVQLSAAEIESLKAAYTVPGPALVEFEADEAVETDADKVVDRVWGLMGAEEFGLAYHLVEAGNDLYPSVEFPLSKQQIKFVALANVMDHATLLATPQVIQEDVSALYVGGQAIPTGNTDVETATRFYLYPSAIETALFHPDSGAEELLRALNGLSPDVQKYSRELTKTVQTISRLRLSLSPAAMRASSSAIKSENAVADAKARLQQKLDHFARASYNYELTVKIRNILTSPGHVVGDLAVGIKPDSKDPVEAARKFIEACSTRSAIIGLLNRAEAENGLKVKGLDGAARDKIVGLMTDLVSLASEYVQLSSESVGGGEQDRSKVTEYVADLRRHVAGAIAAFEEIAKADGTAVVVAAAARYAAGALARFENILAGKGAGTSAISTKRALHGSLPLLNNLIFGRSWYPTPYDKAEMVDAILNVTLPVLPVAGEQRDAVYQEIFRARVEQRSFVAAKRLIDLAKHFGISVEMREKLSDSYAANVETAKYHLEKQVDTSRELAERVIRFSAVTKPEEAQGHLSMIERVKNANVPVEFSLGELTENVADEHIYDIRTASLLLDEVNQDVKALLDEPRQHLLDRVEALVGRLAPMDIERLRSLCQADDLLTAGEFVTLAEEKGEIPASNSRVNRFHDFIANVLPNVINLEGVAEKLAFALAAGEDEAGLKFSAHSEGRRDEAKVLFSQWRDTFRRINTVKSDNEYPRRMADFLQRLGLDAKMREVSTLTSAQRRRFVADYSLKLVRDAESLLLPDFGSLTAGNARLGFYASMPSESDLIELCRTAGSMAVMIFVGEVISPEARTKFLMQNVEARRRIILVDTASLAYSLSETEQRALTLFEIAQPFSYAAPYRDWERDAVPVEMFVGRREEMISLYDPHGSCVVYGGRRLGKTALLKHVQASYNDPKNGVLVAFIDAQGIGNGQQLTKDIWGQISKALPTVFKVPQADPKKVFDEMAGWLEADPRRRIILLVDEADDFVSADSSRHYLEFLNLQKLMTETSRRFKVVFSGLHNVTRLVQTGNDPIKQISSNPQRIGPLMGPELKDAEDLVVRPFAALGIEFQAREDVWRILSHANYYPVLVQTYAKHLLEMVYEEVKQTRQPVRLLTREMVNKVFDRHQASDEVKEKFVVTLRIDQRYELIAYVVADLVLGKERNGEIDEGVTMAEIREASLMFWPQGFADRKRASLFDDLVDEMEGLGILRRTQSKRWTLRSPAITRLLGSPQDVENVLVEFSGREAPGVFDPKSARRVLQQTQFFDLVGTHPSPLTMSQERDILTDLSPVTMIFGTKAADADLVSLALHTAPASFSDADKFDVQVKRLRDKNELVEAINRFKVGSGKSGDNVLVVDHRCDWTPDWVVAAMRSRAVANKAVRVVFAGLSKHAERVAVDPAALRSTSIQTINLEPWSSAYFDSQMIEKFPTLEPAARKSLIEETGGWNSALAKVFHAPGAQKAKARIERAVSEIYNSKDSLVDYGLAGPFGVICKALAPQGNATFVLDDVDVALELGGLGDNLGEQWDSTAAFIRYGMMIGALEALPVQETEDAGKSAFKMTEVTVRLLGKIGEVA